MAVHRVRVKARAFLELATFMVILKLRGFPGIRGWVEACPVAPARAADDVIAVVTHAVDRACMRSPVRMACLARASMATRVLRSYGFPAAMTVGVQRMPFAAHAWVTLEGVSIYGAMDGSSCLRVIDTF